MRRDHRHTPRHVQPRRSILHRPQAPFCTDGCDPTNGVHRGPVERRDQIDVPRIAGCPDSEPEGIVEVWIMWPILDFDVEGNVGQPDS